MLPAIQQVGGYFHVVLNDLARKHSFVKEVRGFGLMLGVQQALRGVSSVIAPILAGFAYQFYGPRVPFYGAAGVIALALLLTGLVREPAPIPAAPQPAKFS